MASKMYIYRADFENTKGHNTRFFYARNARVGKEFCKEAYGEDGKLSSIVLNKIGIMRHDVGSHDAALMDGKEELRLIVQNYGAGKKYAERDEDEKYFKPVSESDELGGDTEQLQGV